MAISQRTESANRLVYVDEAGVAHEILLALLGGQSVWDGRVSQSIPATTGLMSFVGLPAEVSSGSTVTATDVGYMTLAGLVAETSAGSSVSVSAGELTLTGLAADVSAGSTVDAEVGYLTLAGLDADVTTSIGPVFDPGELLFEGLEASVSVSSDVAAEAGVLTLTGSTAEISVGSTVGAVAGSLTLDGYVAEVSSGSTVTATDFGYMTLSGLAAEISAGSTVTASTTPALTLTGLAAEIITYPAPDFVYFSPNITTSLSVAQPSGGWANITIAAIFNSPMPGGDIFGATSDVWLKIESQSGKPAALAGNGEAFGAWPMNNNQVALSRNQMIVTRTLTSMRSIVNGTVAELTGRSNSPIDQVMQVKSSDSNLKAVALWNRALSSSEQTAALAWLDTQAPT